MVCSLESMVYGMTVVLVAIIANQSIKSTHVQRPGRKTDALVNTTTTKFNEKSGNDQTKMNDDNLSTTAEDMDSKTVTMFLVDIENTTLNTMYNNVSESSYSPDNCTIKTASSSPGVPKGKSWTEYFEYEVYKTVFDYLHYFQNIPGVITNPLNVIVALKSEPFQTSELYILVLGIADTFCCATRFYGRMMRRHADLRYLWECRVVTFILALTIILSNLVVVAWTIERFIAVVYPMKLASLCTLRNTKIVIFVLFLFSLLACLPYIPEVSLMRDKNCYYQPFLYEKWLHFESVYYLYGPMLIVTVCNITILVKLRRMSKLRMQMASDQGMINKKAGEQRKLTMLLLTISGTFVFLHIPVSLAYIWHYIYPDPLLIYSNNQHDYAKFILYITLAYAISEFQNEINFFLYCIAGTKFRNTFYKLVCCCRQQSRKKIGLSSATRSTEIKNVSETNSQNDFDE